MVAATLDLDLLACLLIKEALDNGPHTAEKHGSVYDECLTHDLRVVVAAHLGGKLNQGVHLLGEDLHGAASEVKNVQALLDALAGDGGAGGEPQPHEGLVGLDVVLDEALLGGQLEDLVNLEVPEALDVDGTPLLIDLMVEVRVHGLHLVILFEDESLQAAAG